MLGPAGCLTENELGTTNCIPDHWGIIPRTMMLLLKDPNTSLRASSIELYQDGAFDLLNDRKHMVLSTIKTQKMISSTEPAVHLRKQKAIAINGVFVHNSSCYCRDCYTNRQKMKQEKKIETKVTQIQENEALGGVFLPVKTPHDVAKICRTIETTRISHSHLLNDRSSRSHCLVQLEVYQNQKAVRILTFVDLAGSERIKKSGVSGTQQSEATHINQSLSNLGRVVHQLGKGDSFVSFRDSTLTKVLQPCFQGSCFTSVIIHVASEQEHVEESICSLRYGSQMSNVKTLISKPINQPDHSDHKKLLRMKIAECETQLRIMESNHLGGHFHPNAVPSEIRSMQDNMNKLEKLKLELSKAKDTRQEARSKNAPDHDDIVVSLQSQVEIIQMIVLRQKSIAHCWIPPSVAFEQKQVELAALKAKLQFVDNL
jgi:hypothetical protein